MRTYSFTAECKTGQVKTFTFDAVNFSAARIKLVELIETN